MLVVSIGRGLGPYLSLRFCGESLLYFCSRVSLQCSLLSGLESMIACRCLLMTLSSPISFVSVFTSADTKGLPLRGGHQP